MDDSRSNDAENVKPTSLFQAIRQWVLPRREGTLKEALEEVIDEHQEATDSGLAQEEKLMLRNMLTFTDKQVKDIMVPRTDIAAVPEDIALEALKKHILDQRHTRIPVYHGTLDQVQGFIHVKDMLPMLSGDVEFSLKNVLRTMLFVPPSMRVIDLLIKMRMVGSHMAIVVDEHGGTDGLVTMEDVMEEIVGDIQDEHDEDEQPDSKITRVGDHAVEVSARIRIEKLEQALGLNLVMEENDSEFDTLGGLIFFQLGRVPAKGEMISHVSGIHFEIVDADPRRIHKVRIVMRP